MSSELINRGDQIQVAITPTSGGVDGGTYLTALVEIENSYPDRPVPVITPLGAREGIDDLLCSSSTPFTDADGDSLLVAYLWQVNGVDTMFTVDTVPSTEILAGELWTCTITLTDPDGASISGSASIIIRQMNPVWTQLWSEYLDQAVGAITANHSDGTQLSDSLQGQDCWRQTATYSAIYVPVSRTGSELEAVEVDFFWLGEYGEISLLPLSNIFGSNGAEDYFSIDLEYTSPSTSVGWSYGDWMTVDTEGTISSSSGHGNFGINQWQTLRVEYDYLLNQILVYIDGTLITDSNSIPLDQLQDTYVQLRSSGDTRTAIMDVCWGELTIYEGTP